MIDIRPARSDDVTQIEACLTAAYAKARAELQDLPDVTGGIAQDIAENTVFVADKDGAVVGVIVLVAREEALLIANLGVDPKHGGQGIGGRLLSLAEDQARQLGCRDMQLRTHAGLTATLAMYLHLGWQESARMGNVVSMVKPLCSDRPVAWLQ